jgi:tRNA U34 5-methylaminomethyl-2-thiouridine-forming methyltransferase MnmC
MNHTLYSLISTNDGSSTVIDSIHKEHFHSTFGSITESLYIFINHGLKVINKPDVRILEVGFGTGLNCLLTILNKNHNQKILYHAIEKYPLPCHVIDELNYHHFLNTSQQLLQSLHSFGWNEEKGFCENFILKKCQIDLLDFIPELKYDIIYFDAFSYNIQPELWSSVIFNTMFSCINPGGLLVTYSAKGEVKKALRSAGFNVKRIAGPPGKRHILQAYVPLD